MNNFVKNFNVLRGMFEVNCYLAWCPQTKEAVLIDPGAIQEKELTEISQYIESEKLKLKYIINTHGHLDHIGGNSYFAKQTKAKILIHEDDKEMLTNANKNGSALFGMNLVSPKADELLTHNMLITFGKEQLKVLHTPGHTQGSICLYWESKSMAFTGDTLFAESIGRTDLPGGSLEAEINSIHTQLFVLPDSIKIFPGHGPDSTIGNEKLLNPFLK